MEDLAAELLTPVLEQVYGLLWRLGVIEIKRKETDA